MITAEDVIVNYKYLFFFYSKWISILPGVITYKLSHHQYTKTTILCTHVCIRTRNTFV